MEKITDAAGAAIVDRYTVNECFVPGILLMEHAAEAVAEKIKIRHGKDEKILCVAGKGNNGGDAAAVCRLMRDDGYSAECIVVTDDPDKISANLSVQLKALEGLGTGYSYFSGFKEVCKERIKEYDVIVDGIFGTGLNKAPDGIYKEAVDYINTQRKCGAVVYAVDIPSGADASSGQTFGSCVKADCTVTFGLRKSGQLLYPGREICGELAVCEIGFSKKALELEEIKGHIFDCLSKESARELLPARFADSNKGSYGKVLIAAGSENMPGACILAAKTVLRCGCGYASVSSVPSVLNLVASAVPEAVLAPMPENAPALLREAEADPVAKGLNKSTSEKAASEGRMIDLTGYSACLAGPGLGRSERSRRITEELLDCNLKIKGIVYDADAINIIAEKMDGLGLKEAAERIGFIEKNTPENSVFTPHKKELSRLLGIPMEDLGCLFETAKMLSAFSKRIFVLKDAATIVAGRGRLFINTTGNNGMSTAGAGDVLGGIIVSFIAQGCDVYEAACLGVFIHGTAGDAAKEGLSEYGVMAGDISDCAARVIKEML